MFLLDAKLFGIVEKSLTTEFLEVAVIGEETGLAHDIYSSGELE